MLWLSFVTGCLDLQQQRTFAERMDNRVGVVEPLTSKVSLKITQPDCVKVTKAFIDDNYIVAYIRNGCSVKSGYSEYHIDAKAPDGTIIQAWYTNQIPALLPEETFELKQPLDPDNRITEIKVYADRTSLGKSY